MKRFVWMHLETVLLCVILAFFFFGLRLKELEAANKVMFEELLRQRQDNQWNWRSFFRSSFFLRSNPTTDVKDAELRIVKDGQSIGDIIRYFLNQSHAYTKLQKLTGIEGKFFFASTLVGIGFGVWLSARIVFTVKYCCERHKGITLVKSSRHPIEDSQRKYCRLCVEEHIKVLSSFNSSTPLSSLLEHPLFSEWEKKGIPIVPYSEIENSIGTKLGEGTYASVKAMKGSYKGSCVKIYKDRNFEDMTQEVGCLLALQDIEGTSKVQGVVERPLAFIMTRHQMTLCDWLLDKNPSTRQVLNVFQDLCKVMNDIHKKGFCHNDLKSNNIMIDITKNGPKVTVIDFGLMTKSGEVVFPCYINNSRHKRVLIKGWRRRPFYALSLYCGGISCPSTDAYALGYLMRKISSFAFPKPKSNLLLLLDRYAKDNGLNCSVNELLSEVQRSITLNKIVNRPRPRKLRHDSIDSTNSFMISSISCDHRHLECTNDLMVFIGLMLLVILLIIYW